MTLKRKKLGRRSRGGKAVPLSGHYRVTIKGQGANGSVFEFASGPLRFYRKGAISAVGSKRRSSSAKLPTGPDPPIPPQDALDHMEAALVRLREQGQQPAIRTLDPPRPDLGYDREQAAYARRKPELLGIAPGRFVALVGEEMVGPFDTFRDAYLAARRRFGPGTLYVKQILAEEPASEPIALEPCPS